MSTEQNQGAVVTPEANEGEGSSETVSLSKSEYEELVGTKSTVGSLKRELKEAKKALEAKESSDTPQQTNDSALAEKVETLALRVEGINKDSEIDLARKLQKETGLPIDKLLSSKYFKAELEDLRASEANAEASTGIKGDKSNSQNPKSSAAYWIAKGEYPPRDQVSDNKVRKEIRDALVAKEKGTSGKFYNS